MVRERYSHTLYFTIWRKFDGHELREKATYAKEFLENYMVGYCAENRLDDIWLNALP